MATLIYPICKAPNFTVQCDYNSSTLAIIRLRVINLAAYSVYAEVERVSDNVKVSKTFAAGTTTLTVSGVTATWDTRLTSRMRGFRTRVRWPA
jgi:hypothetical protein